MNRVTLLLAASGLLIGVQGAAYASDHYAPHQAVASDWLSCPTNSNQEPAAWYVGPYRGPDSVVGGVDLARDLACAKAFKEQHFPNGFVTVFGSSQIADAAESPLMSKDFRVNAIDDPNNGLAFRHFYKEVQMFAKEWTETYGNKFGYPILTGAGPGLMEAASRGAKDGHGPSVGYTTYYQDSKTKVWNGAFYRHNQEAITSTGLIFTTVSARETAMITHSAAAIFAPGGTGTSWEIFQTLEMIKSQQLRPIPVYFLGSADEWKPLTDMIEDMVKHGTLKVAIVPVVVECPEDLVNRLANDLKLTGDPLRDSSKVCAESRAKKPSVYEKKLNTELNIL
jgi:predicted Rossmann-fold nucleotide-binding protein